MMAPLAKCGTLQQNDGGKGSVSCCLMLKTKGRFILSRDWSEGSPVHRTQY
jgi:hypothetical protein